MYIWLDYLRKKKEKTETEKERNKERKERYSYKSKQISNENIYIVNPSIWAIYPPFQKSYNFCLVCQQYKACGEIKTFFVVTTCSVINVLKVQNALTEIAIHRSYCCLFLLGFLMLSCY